MVKLLLEYGANPNTSPESSGSAVMHARRNPEVLALLLRYGAREESRPFEEMDRLIEERRLDELETRLRETGLMTRQGEASWGEGILDGPANAGDLELIEVLMRCVRVSQTRRNGGAITTSSTRTWLGFYWSTG